MISTLLTKPIFRWVITFSMSTRNTGISFQREKQLREDIEALGITQTLSFPENSESPVPVWKKEIAARRKSKTFVPSAKPETPLRLGEMPAWKRELAERNKIKKRDSIDVQSVSVIQ